MLYPAKLAADFGMLVLIWLVQIIIYPAYYDIERFKFKHWHKRYTYLILFFVIPLMFIQGVLHGLTLYKRADFQGMLAFLFLILCWRVTFRISIPTHMALRESGKNLQLIEKLIYTNWLRTIGWTAVFLLNF